MTTKQILLSDPKKDGFFMPGEYVPQRCVWMLWPYRNDNWRDDAHPAQEAYAEVARAITAFTPVKVGVPKAEMERAKEILPKAAELFEIESDDAWMRDTGPSFLINQEGSLRAVDWDFNAYGGAYDGLYENYENDKRVAAQVAEIEGAGLYQTEGFILEGGSFHVDGEGTVLTTKMCLLSPGRNPALSQAQIEEKLMTYLGAKKVIWLEDGIDPDETNGHVDDVACFARPGEVICIWTEDKEDPFYEVAQKTFAQLSQEADAQGRKLKVHKLCLPKRPVRLQGAETIRRAENTKARNNGDICAATYLNFLITNGGVIVPQFGDANDAAALRTLQDVFPDRQVVGVRTREIVYGGGNIHCITQQVPLAGSVPESR